MRQAINSCCFGPDTPVLRRLIIVVPLLNTLPVQIAVALVDKTFSRLNSSFAFGKQTAEKKI